jgi:hypothetical protein
MKVLSLPYCPHLNGCDWQPQLSPECGNSKLATAALTIRRNNADKAADWRGKLARQNQKIVIAKTLDKTRGLDASLVTVSLTNSAWL